MTYRLTMAPLPISTRDVVFDITRLYRNRARPFGTGIDRIDLAIGLGLVARFGARCRFVHVCLGGFIEVPAAEGQKLLQVLDARWHHGAAEQWVGLGRMQLLWCRLEAALRRTPLAGPDVTYVVASHSGLPRISGGLARLDPQGQAQWVAYIHDLIPLRYPEYQTAHSSAVFARYLAELAKGPVRFLTNSENTAQDLAAYARAEGWSIAAPEAIVPGVEPISEVNARRAVSAKVQAVTAGTRPYFLILGTIEPRKNHTLLLHIWRQMAEQETPPLLVIVGKRGWMAENVTAMLDHSHKLAPHLREFGDLNDGDVAALIEGARALLFPSFAEGLGVPLLEAQAAGVPVIASDLDVFREVAGHGVTFLDPVDGPGWRRAIEQSLAKRAP